VDASDRVLICGGGIGGLSLALSLHAAGFTDIEVFEALTEEKAAKMPVKIIFPTLLCMMPAMFIVILGPAAMRITQTI
jgi:2-polyprenyl-6-methoxyphenol hydroxylase-like FAD-dependent oxidoreductase